MVIQAADKGVAMLVVDKQDYFNKAQCLADRDTYKPIPNNPTIRLKKQVGTNPQNIKTEGGLSYLNYKRLYPTHAVPPSSMAPHNPQS